MNDQQMLNLNKGVAMVGLAAVVTAFELLPLLVMRGGGAHMGRTANLWLDHLLRAGGGVLIATTYVHLLPEVREGVEKLQEAKEIPKWPVEIPELIMCIGFFLMYGTEEIVHRCLANHDHHHHGSGHHHHEDGTTGNGHIQVDPERPLRGILLVIAVSIHQIFEGAAVGLEKNVNDMWTLLGAVAAHKLIIAICVGAEILSGGASVIVQAICLFVFAIASPIGVGIGMGMSSGSGESLTMDFASTILQGLATGTLMFVVFFEILTKSEERGLMRITQYLATLVGFFIMLVLLWFLES